MQSVSVVDPAGLLESMLDATEAGGTTSSFYYDELNRLTAADVGSSTFTYTYDKPGNLTSKDEGPQHDYPTMEYWQGLEEPPGPHALVRAWTAGNDLVEMFYNAIGGVEEERVNAATVRTYEYDEEGLVKTLVEPGLGTNQYRHDASGKLTRRLKPGESEVIYVGDVYEEDLITGDVTKYYFADGRRIAMRKNGTRHFLTEDHLGSTVLATDASGNMEANVRYYPQGGSRVQVGTMPTDKLFTGQQRESDDVYDYGARMYNTDLGRMPQPDPLVPDPFNPQSYNAYSYVINNPANYTDPTGMFGVSFNSGDWQLNKGAALTIMELNRRGFYKPAKPPVCGAGCVPGLRYSGGILDAGYAQELAAQGWVHAACAVNRAHPFCVLPGVDPRFRGMSQIPSVRELCGGVEFSLWCVPRQSAGYRSLCITDHMANGMPVYCQVQAKASSWLWDNRSDIIFGLIAGAECYILLGPAISGTVVGTPGAVAVCAGAGVAAGVTGVNPLHP